MSKNKMGEDSPIPKFIYLNIRRRDGVESLTTLEESEFKVPIDGCMNKHNHLVLFSEQRKFCLLKHIMKWVDPNTHWDYTTFLTYKLILTPYLNH